MTFDAGTPKLYLDDLRAGPVGEYGSYTIAAPGGGAGADVRDDVRASAGAVTAD